MKLSKIKKGILKHSRLLVNLLNVFFIFFFILLPYYLFEGRLFLGGDDTRFYYVYPWEFLTSFTLYSWNNISSLPYYIPNHFWLPFVALLSLLDYIFNSKVFVFNLSFSTIFILGFIYFQKFIRELIGKEYVISILSALIYVLAPITLVGFMFFLAPVWLTALAPIVAYYYICYMRWGYVKDLIKIVIWSIFLSFVYFSVPWILGMILPLFVGLLFYILFVGNPFRRIIKRTLIFIFFIISSQLFWLIPFVKSLISGGSTNLAQKIVSTSLAESFRDTILTTATDNIIYPLLTFYHRQITIDFQWHLKDVYLKYFDYVAPLSIIFIIILFLGVINYNRILSNDKKKIYIYLFAAFLVALYLSTVNIGALKDLFYYLGYLPGFGIFRNFTDKFALAFIFIYSTLLAVSFVVIKKRYAFYPILIVLSFIVVLINVMPIKQIIATPLWKTKNIYTTVNIPEEYIDFTRKVKTIASSDKHILTIPQNNTSYAIITDVNEKNAYVGTSPFKFLTGINDLTGVHSYNPFISTKVKQLIMQRKYKDLLTLLTQINSGYLIVVNNIPQEVLDSYLFDKGYLKYQDKNLINAIVDKEMVRSSKGNYILYKLKNTQSSIISDTEITYKKINAVQYEITFKNLKGKHSLHFKETFHPGWNLYLGGRLVFKSLHTEHKLYGNKWIVNADEIKKYFDKSLYETNDDQSMNVSLNLYFTPQNYFYIGIVMTVVFLISGLLVLVKLNKNEKELHKQK